MNILLISSFIVITIQQCEEIGVSLFNNQLRSGLLPTYLFPEAIDPSALIVQSFPSTINVTSNGWTLSTNKFITQALIINQTYTSNAPNQITVANPNITVEVAFVFNNGSVRNAQGVAILDNVCDAYYTFQINEQPNGYTFTLIKANINFLNTNFNVVYANFPYQDGQLQQILDTLNQGQTIQQALNSYYNTNAKSNIQTFLTSKLKSFPIIKGENSVVKYTFGSGASKQTFSYTVNIASIDIVYTPQIYYQASAQFNIESLTVPYTCTNPITQAIPVQQTISNIEQISLDVIINSFMYAYNKGTFSTLLNPANWKVPYFSWSTGGLNNIMTSVYTSYYYTAQIGGTCQTTEANYASYTATSFSFAMTFNCALSEAKATNFLNFQVQVPLLEIGIEFSRTKKTSYFKILSANNPVITLNPVAPYTIDGEATLLWFIKEGIEKSLVGSHFYEGVFDSQRDIQNEDITYTIQNGIITITNIK